ncbi:hypothetical protein BTA51_20365 [Hahella sp. CCB-MM4]|uniref:ATP-binding protein n=1 Tax=Hahella sp. (strain CCB-MM4) TaxID=1926491 RepID=UPI000B9ADB97|nr:ATP-binding protein [Hahella sp. CCB-MM4]OZG71634.1 hypothetical protein BTA51_20365 [Hahella sp. CCB-MM4]
MFKLDYGKYKGIIISVALFLLLDASVLMLNFYISFEIAEDANSVNLAGRQRMLSQRMVKSLYDFKESLGEIDEEQRALTELKLTYNLFDRTLTAFAEGGTTTGADNQNVSLEQITTANGAEALKTAQDIWTPYSSRFQEIFSRYDQGINDEQMQVLLADLMIYAKANNLELLKLMNILTVDLEQYAASKATRLRMIQTVGISLAVLNFLLIMFHFLRQLRESDVKIEAARKETTDILNTVNEGLFLIRPDMTVGLQHSRQLLDIFGIDSVAAQPVERLLKDIISEKDLKTAMGFIELLFNDRIKEKLTGDLNPLQGIEVNIADQSGRYHTKYLNFDFARVSNQGVIDEILVTVTDITQQVNLEKELAASKASSEQQMEMLTSILHANPSVLKAFVQEAYKNFERINDELKRPEKGQYQYLDKIQAIFTIIHKFKGEASALNLDRFAAMAHDFETSLTNLRNRDKLTGNDFLDLAVQLDKLFSYTDAVQQLVERLAQFSESRKSDKASLLQSERNWDHLSHLVQTISTRQGKKIQLATCGLNENLLDDDMANMINNICIQFLRNAVSHGIESPLERQRQRKSPTGRIDIRLVNLNSGDIELTVEDDGQGIDCNVLRQKALESGRWSPDLVNSWSNRQLIGLIFKPGFSTAEKLSEDAGRGIGMDVIKQQIQGAGGKLSVAHRSGRFCRFTVTIPQTISAQVAA